MQRRHLLQSAGLMATSAALPLGDAVAAALAPNRFMLLRAESAHAGAPFRRHTAAAGRSRPGDRYEIRIHPLRPADGGPVFERLTIDALFTLDDGGTAPFSAWDFSASMPTLSSGTARFFADSSALTRLTLRYRLAAAALDCREDCEIAGAAFGALAAGDYVLVGPRRGGGTVAPGALVHSGVAAAPLAPAPRDFDHVAIQIARAA